MGEQLSKTSSEKQTAEHSTTFSSESSSQISEFQPITCSPQKMKQLSKSVKIKTTCFLKTIEKSLPEPSALKEKQEIESINEILQKIQTQFSQSSEKSQSAEFDKLVPSISDQQSQKNPDIDRIDSLFEFVDSNLNSNEFETDSSSLPQTHEALLINWKLSVNKIMSKIGENFQYFQGQLLICAVTRLYLTESMTFWFMSRLLSKINHLLSFPHSFDSFAQEINTKCKKMFRNLEKKLHQNDLDFQFIYTNWVLGMFSSSLTKETCMRIWIKLLESQNSEETLQTIIIACMECIQEQFETFQSINSNFDLEEMEFSNRNLSKLIEPLKINALIK